jgi:hypothetical protein
MVMATAALKFTRVTTNCGSHSPLAKVTSPWLQTQSALSELAVGDLLNFGQGVDANSSQ